VEVFVGIIDLKLLEVRIAIEKLFMIRDAVILDPRVGTNKTIRQTAHVSLPVTNKEVEVVRSIAGAGDSPPVADSKVRCRIASQRIFLSLRD